MIIKVRQIRFLFPGWALGLTLWLSLVSLPAPAAMVEDTLSMPVVPLRITEQGGEVGVEGYYLGERESSDGHSVDFRNRSFEEYVQYRLKGYVYHPRFVDFEARVKMALLQQQLNNSGLDSDKFKGGSSNTPLFGYSLYLSLFKEHPLSADLHASRDRDAVMELFTDRMMIESEDLGGSLHWKKGPFPMDLSVSQAKFREWGFDSRTESSVKNLDYTIRNSVGRWMQSELRYHYQDYRQDFEAETDLFNVHRRTHLRSHDLNFQNTVYLTDDRRSYLSSNLRYFKQSGDQDLSNYYIQERLNLQHTPNLRTYYMFNYLNNKFREITVENYRAEVGVDHKLFDSLESHLDLHWRETKFEGTSERIWGPTGRLGYRKHTPPGMLSMGYGRTVDRVERRGGSGVRPVIDEKVTLNRGANSFLSSGGDISIVEVTDLTGNTIYDEGFDYELIRQGNRTALRLLTGRIPDGATVLVDYDVAFTSDIRFINDDQNFHINYDFERYLRGLSLYYNWHELTARDAPEDDFSILEFTDQLYGMTWRWRWLTWREEYNVYDSNYNGYTQLRSQLEGLHDIGNRLKLGWRAGLLQTDYSNGHLPEGQDHSDAVFAGALVRGNIRSNGYWQVEMEARKETGQIDETLLGAIARTGFRWRRTRFEAGVRAEMRDRFENKRDHFGAFFRFAREFGGHPRRRPDPAPR